MNVAALQKHLRDLADFLGTAGAGATAVKGLGAVVDGLAPFATMKFEDLAALLVQAEEYRRTGVFTPTAKGKKVAAASNVPAASIDEVKAKVAALYVSAPTVTDAQIDDLLGPIERQFRLPELKLIAAGAQVEGKLSKLTAKNKVIAEIRRAITDARSMAQRSVQ